MTMRRRQLLLQIFSLFDLGLLMLSVYVAVFWTSTFTSLSAFAHLQVRIHTVAGFALLLIVWKISLSSLGLYQSKRLDPRLPEIVDVVKSSALAALLLSLISVAFHVHSTEAPSVIVRFLGLAIMFLVFSRFVLRTETPEP
jgi:FlaA1/EpsC-like NDP-sugar epimerase